MYNFLQQCLQKLRRMCEGSTDCYSVSFGTCNLFILSYSYFWGAPPPEYAHESIYLE